MLGDVYTKYDIISFKDELTLFCTFMALHDYNNTSLYSYWADEWASNHYCPLNPELA